ncbi:MAG: hypothetical protein GXC70_09540 [Sphingomonadaceae bacterium]|nr:hypothetical protein [Sphingomonadaceae bacterium]
MTSSLLRSGGRSGPAPVQHAGWMWLIPLVLPALVAAALQEASQTPPRKEFFDIGVPPQDRTWLCWTDGQAGCSAADFTRAYGLEAPQHRLVGEVVLERIGNAGAYDPAKPILLKERRKCDQGLGAKCRGQVSGL